MLIIPHKQLGDIDPAQSGYWSVRESFVSIVLTNMPMVYPLVRHFFEATISSSGRTKGPHGSSHGYRLESRPGRSASNAGAKHPVSVADDTRWGSEENIVPDPDSKNIETGSSSEDVSRPMQSPGSGKVKVEIKRNRTPGQNPRFSNGSARKKSREQNQIFVTQEYTVIEEGAGKGRV